MKDEILLGDEAVALAAIHAGLSAAYSYPGTPASEIMEFLIGNSKGGKNFIASWSVNEKVAYEEALGASFAGKRAMVSMKHVGLNVAADPFMNSAITGANGAWWSWWPMTRACTALRMSRTAASMPNLLRYSVLSPRTIRRPMT